MTPVQGGLHAQEGASARIVAFGAVAAGNSQTRGHAASDARIVGE
jgi:hypothetical protein